MGRPDDRPIYILFCGLVRICFTVGSIFVSAIDRE